MNALALIQPTDFQTMSSIADIAVKAGFSAAIKNREQALFLMLKGYELGISPFQALDGITIISGKPTVSPQLMLALIERSGQLEDIRITDDGQECTVMMKRKGRSAHTEKFSMTDAKLMGLAGKDNWSKQPRTMRKWRAVAACSRVVFSDIIMQVYTAEEMDADVRITDDGDIIPVLPAPAAPPQPVVTVDPPTVVTIDPPPHWALNGEGQKVNQLMKSLGLVWDDIKSSIEPGRTLNLLSDTTLSRDQVEIVIRQVAEGKKAK